MKFNGWLNKDIIYAVSLLTQIGLTLIGNILVYVFLYKLIEKYFFKSTILFISLILVGVISGFYNTYRLIMRK